MPETCNFIKKETLAQVFLCEFCEISKNTFSCRRPLVAASVDNNTDTLKKSSFNILGCKLSAPGAL